MPTAVMLPDADITTNWTKTGAGADHHDVVDEDISVSYDDNDYVSTTTLTNDERFGFQATPANTNTVTYIALHVRAGITDNTNAAYIRITLYHSTSTQIGSTQDITCGPAADVPNDGTITTVTKNWDLSGSPLTKAQADSLEAKFVFNNA